MIKTFSIFLSLASVSVAVQPIAISKKYWSDPSFQKSFNGSYAINARIEPSVTGEQRALLVNVQTAMQKGNKKQALALLTNNSLTNNSAALQYNLGNIALELGKNEQALKAYKRAISLYPSFRRAHKNLGVLYLREGKVAEAEQSLQKALELGDNSGSSMGMLGYCYLQKKQFASALQAYRNAQLTEPEVIDWKAGVAQCLSEIGNDREALALLAEVVEQRPDEPSYQLLYVNVLLHLEREHEAAAGLELLRRKDQLDYPSLALLAQLHVRSEALSLAEPLFSKLQEGLRGDTLQSYLQSVEAVIQGAHWAYAETLLAVISEDLNASVELDNKHKRLQAFVLIQQGKEGAERLLRGIIKGAPNDGEALVLLADYLQTKKQFAEAELLYTRSANVEKTAYRALLAHGKMLVKQQRYAAATDKLSAALELNPSDSLKKYLEAVEQLTR